MPASRVIDQAAEILHAGLGASDVGGALDAIESAEVALGSEGHGLYLWAVHRDSDNLTYLMGSSDGKAFGLVKRTNLYTPASLKQRDPSLIRHAGRYWIAHTLGELPSTGSDKFQVLVSDDLLTWTAVVQVDCSSITGSTLIWAPEWFVDDDGSVTVFVAANPGGGASHTLYRTAPTNAGMTTWSTPTAVTVTGKSNVIDGFVVKKGSTYYLWYKDDTTAYIEYASSSTLAGPYTVLQSGNWAGWGSSVEAPCLVKVDATRWRLYMNQNSGYTSIKVDYSESTDDWATWSTRATVATPFLAAHGTVRRFRDLATVRYTFGTAIGSGVLGSVSAGVAGSTVRRSATQSIAHNTGTAVSWDTVDQNDLGAYAGGAPTRLTAPTTGWYIASATIAWSSNTNWQRVIDIRRNGSDYIVSQPFLPGTARPDPQFGLSTPLYLGAGDYIEIVVYQNSTATLTITGRASLLRAS